MRSNLRLQLKLLYVVFLLSGIAGLGYQLVWTRMFAIGLGHEMPSVLAVVSAFFGGIALGGWLLDRSLAVARWPGRWYVGLELLIGFWALASIFLIPLANDLTHRLIGPAPSFAWHWLIAFSVPMLVLLPATFAMGATLPAMDRLAAHMAPDQRIVGGLYAANTLGAVVGTLGSAFLVIPALGFSNSLLLFAALNLLSAGAVFVFFGRVEREESVTRPTEHEGHHNLTRIAFFTGLLGIGFEVLGVRVLSHVFENTVYSFASALSVFLAGTALGGAIYQRLLRMRDANRILRALLITATASCLVGVVAMSYAHWIYLYARQVVGPIASEMVVAAAVFVLPTIAMGATFSHLAQNARRATGGVGAVLATNTLGGAVAPLVFGILLLPESGVKWAILLISFGYLALIPADLWPKRLIAAAALAFLMMLPLRLEHVVLRRDEVLLRQLPGVMASVAVTQDERGHRNLRVNNHYEMGGTQQPTFERLQAVLPLLLHREPQRVLFLGVGTGITIGGANIQPSIQATGVELVPEVIEVLPFFEPQNALASRNDQFDIRAADARRFIRSTGQRYDVIVADLFHPARDGAGSLYTVEHFTAMRAALTGDGLVCVWLPSYQLDSPVFKTILRTFLNVFPDATAILSTFQIGNPAIGLVSRTPAFDAQEDWFRQRVADERLQRRLSDLRLFDGVRLFGHVLARAEILKTYAGSGPLNRDDHPIVTFAAPSYTYRRYPKPWQRLGDLLDAHGDGNSEPQTATEVTGDAFAERIRAYRNARDVYLRGLVLWKTGDTPAGLEALVESTRMSRDFDHGIGRGLEVARRYVQQGDRSAARLLLKRLAAAQPDRSEALDLTRALGM